MCTFEVTAKEKIWILYMGTILCLLLWQGIARNMLYLLSQFESGHVEQFLNIVDI